MGEREEIYRERDEVFIFVVGGYKLMAVMRPCFPPNTFQSPDPVLAISSWASGSTRRSAGRVVTLPSWKLTAWVRGSALPLPSCVATAEFLTLAEPQFLLL